MFYSGKKNSNYIRNVFPPEEQNRVQQLDTDQRKLNLKSGGQIPDKCDWQVASHGARVWRSGRTDDVRYGQLKTAWIRCYDSPFCVNKKTKTRSGLLRTT